MNAAWSHFIGVWIVLMMLAFVGVWIWAWSGRHADTFDALARLPMEDKGEQA
ncbi:MAG: cbb3-type cytochrome c oxidase subunit 3 [Proteobacteria bacterium]|jgi:cytochrome c oxidase cbb3-type subunit 4|nr:cbb3-type cytochrome c oxidase subunit 3 [Pseudomonadota bacterium]